MFENVIVIVTFLAAVSVAVTQLVKFKNFANSKYMPLVSLVIGMIVGLLITQYTVYDYYTMALLGALSGLTGAGAFDMTDLVNFMKDKNKARDDL